MRFPRIKIRREHAPKLVAGLFTIPSVILASLLHAFFIAAPNAVAFDDGYTVAAAERLIDGRWLPYVDACSHRGPMLYWVVTVAQKLSGRFNWSGPRWLMFLVSLTTIGGMVGVGFLGRLPLAGAVASLFYVYLALATAETDAAFGVTGEALAVSFGILALVSCTWALVRAEKHRSRCVLLALCGCFAALAGMTKQTALLFIVPFGVWTLASACSLEGSSRRARVVMVLALAGGFCAPVLIILARYALAGELGTFWYWFYTYNTQVYMASLRGHPIGFEFNQFIRDQPFIVLLTAMLCILGARPFADVTKFPRGICKAFAESGLEVTSSLLVLVSFFGVVSPRRYFAPYFHLLYPFLALAIGVRIALLVEAAKGTWVARLVASILLGGLLTWWMVYAANLRYNDILKAYRTGARQAALPEPLCDFLDRHSGRNDSLFIWGFDGDLYVTCHRRPATRFTYMTLVAGTVPPAWNDLRPEWVAKDARRHVMEDFEKNRPKVVLDMPGNMHNVSLQVVPELVEYLAKKYCQLPSVSTKNGRRAAVWVLKTGPTCAIPGNEP